VITYVDTSSLLKLLIDEDGSERAVLLWDRADVLASVILVAVEARAALAAAERAARLTVSQHRMAKQELAALLDELTIIEVTEDLIAHASELAETDALRGYDAVHLAAALAVEANVITSADAELCDAALRHGLHVAKPLDD
jgi:uncharacterized protein